MSEPRHLLAERPKIDVKAWLAEWYQTHPRLEPLTDNLRPYPRRRPPQTIEAIRTLRAEGLTLREIADRLRLTFGVVCGLYDRHVRAKP